MRLKLALFLFFLLSATLLLVWAFTPLADARFGQNEDEEADPDRPAGMHIPFNEGEYIQKRDAFIALLRGVDPTRPSNPEGRIRANALMDQQLTDRARLLQESLNSNAPLALPNWTELGPNPIPLGQTSTTRVNVSGRIAAIEIDPDRSKQGLCRRSARRRLSVARWRHDLDADLRQRANAGHRHAHSGPRQRLALGRHRRSQRVGRQLCGRWTLPDRKRQHDRDSGRPDQSDSKLQ